MDNNEARKILEDWISHSMKYTDKMTLPVKDENIYNGVSSVKKKQKDGISAEGDVEFYSYSFKHLLKIAYDLKDA
jgi:hypothetical protein